MLHLLETLQLSSGQLQLRSSHSVTDECTEVLPAAVLRWEVLMLKVEILGSPVHQGQFKSETVQWRAT